MDAFLITTTKGEVLLRKLYRSAVIPSLSVLHGLVTSTAPPFTNGTYIHHHNDVCFIVFTSINVNAAMFIEYTYSIIELMTKKLGVVTADTVEANMLALYELVDETADFGYPQFTNISALNLLSDTEVDPDMKGPESLITQITGALNYRPTNIKYKKNQVMIDVEEFTSATFSKMGTMLGANVKGNITLKNYLTGMPECRMVLSARKIENFTYHNCVKASTALQFTPPDGEFTLCNYNTETPIIPVHLLVTKKSSHTRLEYVLQLKTDTDVGVITVKVPLPKNFAGHTKEVTSGNAKCDTTNSCVSWKLKNPSPIETLTLNYDLIASTSGKVTNNELDIKIDYTIPGFSSSELKVRSLKVQERHDPDYQVNKWIRYQTRGKLHYRA